ncbi:unnamed protein product [Clonostachys rosea f. rosea IK726]|uniref:Rhodopsin domain-containing protein n=2 Tax=Bionectria ochroleuca TaxID=29856 RepID=A0A0B7KQ87_BIOOC|nr:unnamed protein product [Clonostachys rosea f. rosea IK726]
MAVRDTLPSLMAAFIAVDVAIVLLRMIVRLKMTTLGYDDYVIAVATAAFVLMCAFCFVSLDYGFGLSDPAVIATFANYNQMEASRYFTIAQVTYVAGFPVVRISVALVLHRIVQGKPKIQRLLVISMVFVGIYALGCLLVDVLQCIPLKAVWGDGTGRCLTITQLAGLGFAVSALDIASALFYAILPVFLLKGLQMGTRTKIAIMFLLGLGAGTVVVSIVRLRSLVLIVSSTDIVQALDLQLESFIYSVLEFGLSILCASLVALRPLVKYLPFGSHGRSSGKQGRSGGYGTGGGLHSGTGEFEMNSRRHNHSKAADAIPLDSDDAESERNILQDPQDHPRSGIWKHSKINVTYEKNSKGKLDNPAGVPL